MIPKTFRLAYELSAVLAIALLAAPATPVGQKKGGGGAPPPAPALVFVSTASKTRYSLMVANADGSNVREVRASVGESCRPSFSPDGQTILFNTVINGVPGVYAMGLDGGGTRLVLPLRNPYGYADAKWSPTPSPDGNYKIALMDRDQVSQYLCIANTDGSGAQLFYRPLDASGARWDVTGVTWAPDGRRLAVSEFTGDTARWISIFSLAVDSGSSTLVVSKTAEYPLPVPWDVTAPAWAVSDEKIAFSTYTGGQTAYDIGVLDITEPSTPLFSWVAATAKRELLATWSPDGQSLFYDTQNETPYSGTRDIVRSNLDGSGATLLIKSAMHPYRRRF